MCEQSVAIVAYKIPKIDMDIKQKEVAINPRFNIGMSPLASAFTAQ